ncbi:MAG: VOC family protein [Candidatus Baltobacteraceae bacterium]
MSNRVIHFEIPMDDPERATKFYAALFGWDIKPWDGPQKYWLAKTGPDSERGINGAFIPRTEINTVVNTVAVEDLAASLALVKECGGVVVEELSIPTIGEFAYCRDTEGNLFGMLQPLAR